MKKTRYVSGNQNIQMMLSKYKEKSIYLFNISINIKKKIIIIRKSIIKQKVEKSKIIAKINYVYDIVLILKWKGMVKLKFYSMKTYNFIYNKNINFEFSFCIFKDICD